MRTSNELEYEQAPTDDKIIQIPQWFKPFWGEFLSFKTWLLPENNDKLAIEIERNIYLKLKENFNKYQEYLDKGNEREKLDEILAETIIALHEYIDKEIIALSVATISNDLRTSQLQAIAEQKNISLVVKIYSLNFHIHNNIDNTSQRFSEGLIGKYIQKIRHDENFNAEICIETIISEMNKIISIEVKRYLAIDLLRACFTLKLLNRLQIRDLIKKLPIPEELQHAIIFNNANIATDKMLSKYSENFWTPMFNKIRKNCPIGAFAISTAIGIGVTAAITSYATQHCSCR